MKMFTIKNDNWKNPDGTLIINYGWGNGYVAIPPTHPLYGLWANHSVYYHDLLNVHGGITCAVPAGGGGNSPEDWWVVGFDTRHYGDNTINWPKEAVEAETRNLFCQLLDIELGKELGGV